MWRQFARETPTRPNLALLGTGLALAAAIGLAWVVTTSRSTAVAGGLQSLPDWPIVFALPDGVSWSRQFGPIAASASADGAFASVAYVGHDPRLGSSVLIIGFQVLPEGTTVNEAMPELTGTELEDAEQVLMGPLTGRMMELALEDGGIHLVGVACSPTGLALAVQYVTPGGGGASRQVFQAVCRSIDYKN